MELHDIDGKVLMHDRAPYDPAKARAYYLKTRQLKGRKKGATTLPVTSKRPDQVKYRKALEGFLKKLPMAKEGASLEATEKFVDEMRGKTDAELRDAIKNMKDTPGTKDASIKAATAKFLLDNRTRVRSKKADAKKIAKANVKLKTAATPRVSKKTLIRTG